MTKCGRCSKSVPSSSTKVQWKASAQIWLPLRRHLLDTDNRTPGNTFRIQDAGKCTTLGAAVPKKSRQFRVLPQHSRFNSICNLHKEWRSTSTWDVRTGNRLGIPSEAAATTTKKCIKDNHTFMDVSCSLCVYAKATCRTTFCYLSGWRSMTTLFDKKLHPVEFTNGKEEKTEHSQTHREKSPNVSVLVDAVWIVAIDIPFLGRSWGWRRQVGSRFYCSGWFFRSSCRHRA